MREYSSYNQIEEPIAYFENIEYQIIRQLELARDSVDICVAWISIQNFERVFQNLINRGVKIRLICNDDDKNNFDSCIKDIYRIKPSQNGLMHHKFCIIDNQVLITGSYNWSKNARNHHENIRISKNEYPLILQYLNEFEDLIIGSKPLEQEKCSTANCKGITVNISVNATDIHSRSNYYKESIWQVCLKNNHCVLLSDKLIEDYSDYEEEEVFLDTKDNMLYEFQKYRGRVNNYMRDGQLDIQALGYIEVDNWNDVIEYNESENYILTIYWKHTYFRNRLQTTYFEDNGEIYKIINWSQDI